MFTLKLMFVCLVVFTESKALKCPEIAEELTRVTLTCQSSLPQFAWRATSRMGATRNVSDCFGPCKDLVPGYEGSFLNSSTQPPLYESSLTIEAIIRNESKFWCNKDFCTVKVYVKPMQPTCTHYALGHHGSPHRSFLEMNVEVAESYPEAKCFMKTSPDSRMSDIAVPTIWSTALPNGNFHTFCRYDVPLNGTLPNSYFFTVSFYPDVHPIDKNISVETTFGPMLIEAPSVALGPDCSIGIISDTSTVNCSCIMTDPGYPEGWVTWYTTSNQVTGRSQGDALSILTVTYDPLDPKPSFTCSPVSALGRLDPGLVFSPKFAGQQKTNEAITSSSDQTVIVAAIVSAALLVTAIGVVLAVVYLKRRWDHKTPKKSPNLSTTNSYHNANDLSGMTIGTSATRAKETQVNPRLERNIPSQKGSTVTMTTVTESDKHSFSEYDCDDLDSNATDSSQTYATPNIPRKV